MAWTNFVVDSSCWQLSVNTTCNVRVLSRQWSSSLGQLVTMVVYLLTLLTTTCWLYRRSCLLLEWDTYLLGTTCLLVDTILFTCWQQLVDYISISCLLSGMGLLLVDSNLFTCWQQLVYFLTSTGWLYHNILFILWNELTTCGPQLIYLRNLDRNLDSILFFSFFKPFSCIFCSKKLLFFEIVKVFRFF